MVRPIFMFRSLLFFIILLFNKNGLAQKNSVVSIGAVQDFETDDGKRNWASISLAFDDFYAKKVKNSSKIVLHPKDSMNDIVDAASAVIDLIKNNKAQVILGPITSSETKFVAELCTKTHIPVLSFTASSPSLSSVTTPYFVRSTLNETSQVGAIAAVVNHYVWREVVPVYEDTDFGSGIVPSLIDAFNSIDTRVPYRSVVPSNASDEWFEAELYKLMSMQTRVFVVHMMTKLGKRLFQKAKELNLMNKGYVWIITDSLTNNLHAVDTASLNLLEGVFGKLDAVVGDTTIIANRSNNVDLTVPYTESGVSMVVFVRKDDNTDIWIFLQPLTTDLWLTSLPIFFFTGFVVWVVEHRINEEFRGSPSQQMGTIFYFAFSTLVFAHRERLESNLSRFIVIIWVFVVLILTSSYTASLTSMLTV